jgi:hypothetical protein
VARTELRAKKVRPHKSENFAVGAHFAAEEAIFSVFVICALRTFLAPKPKKQKGTHSKLSVFTADLVFLLRTFLALIPPGVP